MTTRIRNKTNTRGPVRFMPIGFSNVPYFRLIQKLGSIEHANNPSANPNGPHSSPQWKNVKANIPMMTPAPTTKSRGEGTRLGHSGSYRRGNVLGGVLVDVRAFTLRSCLSR